MAGKNPFGKPAPASSSSDAASSAASPAPAASSSDSSSADSASNPLAAWAFGGKKSK